MLDQLLAGRDPQEVFAKDGLARRAEEGAVGADSERRAGRASGERRRRRRNANRRNGSSKKTVLTGTSKMTLAIPRDRAGTFDPKLIAKYQRRFPDFDDKIISMYARGMTVREIRGHLEELYGIDVSPDLISAVTDAVLEEVAEWQNRPLDACYPLVFFDAMRVKIRDEGFVRNKAVYIALGILPDGTQGDPRHLDRADRGRQVLAAGHERAEEPRRRRHPDRRRRWPEGLPRGDHRRLPRDDRADLHRAPDPPLARASSSWKDRKPIVPALRAIYRAKDAEAGLAALEAFEAGHWGQQIPGDRPELAAATGSRSIPFFAFPEGVRRIIYTTNAIEALNSKLRRAVRTRGHFPE